MYSKLQQDVPFKQTFNYGKRAAFCWKYLVNPFKLTFCDCGENFCSEIFYVHEKSACPWDGWSPYKI